MTPTTIRSKNVIRILLDRKNSHQHNSGATNTRDCYDRQPNHSRLYPCPMSASDAFKVSASFRHILRENLSIIFFCMLAVYYSSHIHGGFLMLGFVVITLFNQIIHLFFVWRRPSEFIRRCVSIAIILYAGTLVYLLHQQYAQDTERAAETVLNAIHAFKESHSDYPETLDTVSAETPSLALTHRIQYGLEDTGKPYLFYPETSKILTTRLYDFSDKKWKVISN